MMMSTSLLALLALVCAVGAISNDKELKLVHFIFRHGIRAPADTYPKDPYAKDTFFPTGWGQVTNQGKLKLYEHGKFLRRRYGNFLGDHYNSDIFHIQTTDVDRTKVTAQCVSAGLWPPDESLKWGPIDWLPVPVNYEPLDKDSLLLVRRPCAQYNLELDRITATPEIKRKLQSYSHIFDQVSKHTGKNVKTFEDAQDVYTTLMSEEAFNLTLPAWTSLIYPDALRPPAEFSYVLNAYNDKLNRLKGGVLLKKLINDWQKARDGSTKPAERKGFLYIGHDSTIANILSTLKVFDPQVPAFAVNVLFEFARDKKSGEYGVEIFLRNSTEVNGRVHQLTVPNCDAFCPLDRLIALTSNVIPQNWDEECKSDDPNYVPPAPGGP